ncbi:unnamed protein product [Candidula unifasciata]|uniref:Disease resistance R13L4/SHOC-2-like LRR domain-containing protein n=1 Tax=Candidula unifasciata TaxID=100452 RepID=A0A8S3Z850_9EUPU|nr:unnamed protein product [Candidula unifasciata]
MNTKFKTSAEALPHSLGINVVLPLGPRSAVPPASRRPNSIERRIFKRTLSTEGAIASVSATKTRPPPGSANVRRLSERRKSQPESQDSRQDVKFLDIGDTALRSNSSKQRKKGLSTSDILKLCLEEDPNRVFEVSLHGKGLTSTPDLEKFHKLRILDVSGNYIQKISGLGSNKDLRELKIYDNDITEIDGLGNLKELCHLQLQHNKIGTIGRGLCNLKKLQCLRLDSNQISKLEIPELVSCSNITSLDLSHNRLETLAPLSYLPNLSELFASGNRIKNTGDLTKCKKLQEVDLSRNQISDLSGLANLPNLQILDVSHNLIKTLNSLIKLRSLEELNINTNYVKVLSCVASLFPSLQVLLACDNQISSWDEIGTLSGCLDLVELYVEHNPFTMSDGEMPDYHHFLAEVLTGLEVIDGVTLKKSDVKQDGVPLMRPMSASSMITVRQLDSQLKAASDEQGTLMKSINERFDALKMLMDSLPSEPPRSQTAESTNTSTGSRCSSRSRLKEAKNFAAMNFHGIEGEGPV